jgi:hypothetical protein
VGVQVPPRAETPTFKWLILNNLRSTTLGQIQNLVPHRLMPRLNPRPLQATLFVLGLTPIDVWTRKMDIDGDGGRREFGLRGQRRGTESIVAEMVERRERMGVIAWFCSRLEQPKARTHQKTARNNAFEQRIGLNSSWW